MLVSGENGKKLAIKWQKFYFTTDANDAANDLTMIIIIIITIIMIMMKIIIMIIITESPNCANKKTKVFDKWKIWFHAYALK